MTAINSDNTSITGSGITSINGEGNFEVSKPTTILASKTNNIVGEAVTISPSSSINLTTARINLVTAGLNREGITINANDMPLTLQGKVVIDGSSTTYINTPVKCKGTMEAYYLRAIGKVSTEGEISAANIYGRNFGSNVDGPSSLITAIGAKNNIVLGANNTYINYSGSTAYTSENIIIGSNNEIAYFVANDFIVGQYNEISGSYSTALGLHNNIQADYSLVKGQDNNIQALGATAFGSKNVISNLAEFSLVSGVGSTVNGKTSTVLGDNLRGSTETGSMTIGTFNEKKMQCL